MLTDITIPLWGFIVLIATNVFVWVIALIFAELVCYIHDMIEVEIKFRKYYDKETRKRLKENKKERK